MLTNAAWERAARSVAAEEKWVFYIYYDDGDPDGSGALKDKFIAVSDSSFLMGGVQVWGFVKTMPQIRGSISLPESKAKVENVTLALWNKEYHGLPLSDELGIDGTRRYLNRKVQVFSYMPTAGSSLLIHNGWLREAPHNDEEISLAIEPRLPWDNVKIPSVKASDGLSYYPVVYGEFEANDSTAAAPAVCTSRSLWPVRVYKESRSSAAYSGPVHRVITTGGRLHYYSSATDYFVPITDAGNTYRDASVAETGGNAMEASGLLRNCHVFNARLSAVNASEGTWANKANAFDDAYVASGMSSTYANQTQTFAASPGHISWTLYYDFPLLDLPIADEDVKVYARVYCDTAAGMYLSASIKNIAGVGFGFNVGDSDIISLTLDQTWHNYTMTYTGGDRITKPPSFMCIYVQLGETHGGFSGLACNLRVAQIGVAVTCETTYEDEALASGAARNRIETLYCGADGLARSWTTGVVATVQEMHRDLLIRFAGLSTTAPAGYSDLDTARAGWNVRWWLHEPEDLGSILEKAQFEGAFIYLPGLTDEGRYVFVKSSYSAGDEAATLREGTDTGQIEWKHTPFSDLKTKRTIRYQRHPADDSRYIQTHEFEDATARADWAIKAEENVETSDLDMLVDGVDEHAAVYGAICGTIKKGFRTTIKTPLLWLLEKGDVVRVAPKRGTEARFFMVTETTREVMGLEIEAWEVG